jgi:hypothetical protein
MDILISIVITGMAVGYITELLSSLVSNPKLIKMILTLPLSVLSLWLLGYLGVQLFVGAFAAAFFALFALLIVNRPVSVTNLTNRR